MDATAIDWIGRSWDDAEISCGAIRPTACHRPLVRQGATGGMHGATVVMLAPARTDTRWWHEHVQGIADEVRFLKGRVKFVGPEASSPAPRFPRR